MTTAAQQTPAVSEGAGDAVEQFDVIIIGAGVMGLYQLYMTRELGFSVQILEEGGGVGGTWYWARYPGARFDSESPSYGYSFSEELLQEWDWKEHFSAQPDTERYLNYVADKFDLRRNIELNTAVTSADWLEDERQWEIGTDGGRRVRARFLITAVGILSTTYIPDFEGVDSFEGTWVHTGRWPKEGVDLAGKRVGVIGTGATAIQLIPMIAEEVAHLTVFQRTANYALPLRNSPIDPETQRQIKASYPEILQACYESPAGFMYGPDKRSALDVSREERMALYEELWAEPGFKKYMANFPEVQSPGEINEEYAEFVREKIRERVNDPAVAEMLVPKTHPFSSKRVPLESGYYEAFNRENVLLVDVREAPIERITPRGVQTKEAEYELDVIVFATGYDSVTGPLTKIDIRGVDGQTLGDRFAQEGFRTYLGVQTVGFPNLFTINAASAANWTRGAEWIVEWMTEALGYMRDQGVTRIEATSEAEAEWMEHAADVTAQTLLPQATSWFLGNNIPGKVKGPLVLLLPPDSCPDVRAKRAEVAANGYEGFVLQ